MPYGDEKSIFDFRMVDRNSNEVDLSQFHEKDIVVVINCKTFQEVEEMAPLYYKLEDLYNEKIQILCLPGNSFVYSVRGEESSSLIDYLKERTYCQAENEDGLTFIINNKDHKPEKEAITFVGNNLKPQDLFTEIAKVLK